MNIAVDLKTAKIVPIGPHTKFPGNDVETWDPGYGVQLEAYVGIYLGTAIVPFMSLADAEGFLEQIRKDNECLT